MRSPSTSRWSSWRPTRSRSKCRRPPPACCRCRRQGRRHGRCRRAARPDQEGAGAPRRQAAGAKPPEPPPRAAPAPRGARSRGLAGCAMPPAPLAPSVRKIAAETGIDAADVAGTGKDGRVTKGDMLAAIERAARSRRRPRPPPVQCARRRRRRCRARRARAHDAAAPDHRAPAQGCAEHRRHADDLQRGRHERR